MLLLLLLFFIQPGFAVGAQTVQRAQSSASENRIKSRFAGFCACRQTAAAAILKKEEAFMQVLIVKVALICGFCLKWEEMNLLSSSADLSPPMCVYLE